MLKILIIEFIQLKIIISLCKSGIAGIVCCDRFYQMMNSQLMTVVCREISLVYLNTLHMKKFQNKSVLFTFF